MAVKWVTWVILGYSTALHNFATYYWAVQAEDSCIIRTPPNSVNLYNNRSALAPHDPLQFIYFVGTNMLKLFLMGVLGAPIPTDEGNEGKLLKYSEMALVVQIKSYISKSQVSNLLRTHHDVGLGEFSTVTLVFS
jgi:hypothetical protein